MVLRPVLRFEPERGGSGHKKVEPSKKSMEAYCRIVYHCHWMAVEHPKVPACTCVDCVERFHSWGSLVRVMRELQRRHHHLRKQTTKKRLAFSKLIQALLAYAHQPQHRVYRNWVWALEIQAMGPTTTRYEFEQALPWSWSNESTNLGWLASNSVAAVSL